ncbi:MAG: ATP-binding protein [Lachnospirales bacterium]
MSKITLTQLFAVPLLSAIILYMAIVTVEYNLNYSSLIVTMSIFLINIVFFNFYEKINEAADKKSEMISLNNQIKYYTTLYYNLNKERDNALELKHNIKNSLINIKSFLVRQNNLKAIEEIDYILGNTCQEDIYICEVPIIDAMVNFKNQQAKELGINMEVSTSLNVKINISNSDLANILGNALDNAIEACSKNTNESNKVIKLQIEQRNNSLYIRISNPYEKEIKLKNNFPLSSKRKNEYGIGIRTIQKIVRNKNSIMNINLDNKIFELEIIIFSAIK